MGHCVVLIPIRPVGVDIRLTLRGVLPLTPQQQAHPLEIERDAYGLKKLHEMVPRHPEWNHAGLAGPCLLHFLEVLSGLAVQDQLSPGVI